LRIKEKERRLTPQEHEDDDDDNDDDRKRLAMIGRNKSVGPDGIRGSILKMGGETMIPYLARLLDITINNGTIPRHWKKVIVVLIHKGGDRSAVKNYGPVSLTSVVCKQMERVIVGYIRQV